MGTNELSIAGMYVDVVAREIYPARVWVADGRVAGIERLDSFPTRLPYIMPGLVDAHVHIESSMLVPSAFARVAVRHGTVGTVSDPHEIANVCGEAGVHFMVRDGAATPFKFCFGVPSCVPATSFETAGAVLDAEAVERLFRELRLKYLSEMMNFPGVVHGDPEVMAKIAVARRFGRRIDGHAPGLRGEALDAYLAAGITTDHECFTLAEAEEKLAKGMKVLIREGSAARNFDELWPLIDRYPDQVMLCTDDMHPDALVEGHLDVLIRRGLRYGVDFLNLLRAATVNPVRHYGLNCGLLQVGDAADFIVVDDLKSFRVLATYIDGECVFDGEDVLFAPVRVTPLNRFEADVISVPDLEFSASGTVRVIEAIDGQIVTGSGVGEVGDPDLLKLVVVNRYENAPPAVGFVRGFGLRCGALASSVAHDSHNVIAVGVDDHAIARAVNLLVEAGGGLSFVDVEMEAVLPLPVAGLMSTWPAGEVAGAYRALDARVKAAGCPLSAPYMTLSFLALPVIPHLKLTDKGLFDVDRFGFVGVEEAEMVGL